MDAHRRMTENVMSDLVTDPELAIARIARLVRDANHRLSTNTEASLSAIELSIDNLHSKRGRVQLDVDVLLRRDTKTAVELLRNFLRLADTQLARGHDTFSI